MKKSNGARKILAWLLVLTMSFMTLGAFADDVNVRNEDLTVEGNVEGNASATAEGKGNTAELIVTGDVEGNVNVNAWSGGTADVEVGGDVEGQAYVNSDDTSGSATLFVEGNVEDGLRAFADEPTSVTVVVEGNVTNEDGQAVNASSRSGGETTVAVGNVISGSNGEDGNGFAINVNANKKDAETDLTADKVFSEESGMYVNVSATGSAEVVTGDITAANTGVNVNNQGGTADIVTGDISSGDNGVEAHANDATTQVYLTEDEFNAMGFGEPNNINTWNEGDGRTTTNESFQGSDGIWYYRQTNEEQMGSYTTYWKNEPVTDSEGSTAVETGDVTVINSDEEYTRGASASVSDDGFDVDVTVGNILVVSDAENNGAEGAYVNADEGTASLTTGNIQVDVKENFAEGANAYARNDGTAVLTTGNIDVSGKNTRGLYANAEDDSTLNILAGNITTENSGDMDSPTAVDAHSSDEAEVIMTVGDVETDERGVYLRTNGGTIDAEFGNITSGGEGLAVYGSDNTIWEDLTEDQFKALGFTEPDGSWDNNPESETVHGESFEGTDGSWYYRYTHKDGSFTYGKSTPDPESEGFAKAQAESVSVDNVKDEYIRGVVVNSEDDGFIVTADVGKISVTSTSTQNGAEGANINANEGVATLTAGDISVTAEKYADGVGVTAENGVAGLDAGDINVTAGGYAQGLYASAYENGVVYAEAGNVTTDNGTSNAPAVSVYTADNSAVANVSVGNISTDSTGFNVNNQGGTLNASSGTIEAEETGLSVYNQDSYKWHSITAEEVEAMNLGDPYEYTWTDDNGNTHTERSYSISDTETIYCEIDSNGYERWSRETKAVASGDTTVVTKDITVTADPDAEGTIYVSGADLYARSDLGGTHNTDATIYGNVTVTNSIGSADGINATQYTEGTMTATVYGDVTVSADEHADGFTVNTASKGIAEATIDGDLSVNGGSARGVYAFSADGGKASAEVDGDVTVIGDQYATAVSADSEDVYNEGSKTSVAVLGDISAVAENGNAIGVDVSPYAKGDVVVDVIGDITAQGESATGIMAVTTKGTTADIAVSGNITAESADGESGYGAQLRNRGGELSLTVMGDIEADSFGIILDDTQEKLSVPYDGELFVPGDNDKLIYSYDDEDGNEVLEYIHVDEDGNEIKYTMSDGEVVDVWSVVPYDLNPGETIATITGDVTADQAAYIALENDKSKMDLIVDGTISGESSSVLVSSDTVGDNLTITVWEIKPDEDGNLIERQDEWDPEEREWTTKADEELEKQIQYIIRIEQPEAGSIDTEGTTEYEGYNVAKEGDTVTMKINIPDGYKLIDAFNGTDTKVSLLKDANGNYYIVVPRGGAVTLSVKLEKIPAPAPDPTDSEEVTEEGNTPAATYTPAAKTEPAKMNDEEIAAAVEEVLTKNAIAEDSKVEVKTSASGAKTVVITPAETATAATGEGENTEASAIAEDLQLSVPTEVLTQLKDSDVEEISVVSKTGTATVSLETAEVLETAADKQDAKLVVNIAENTDKVEKAQTYVPAGFKAKAGAVAVTARVEDKDGNITVLSSSAKIKIQLKVEYEEGMKILFIDANGNVTETNAVWVEATADVPGHWEVPYMGEGTYLPVVEEK